MKKVGIAYDDRNLFATEHQVTNAVSYARRLLLQKSHLFCFFLFVFFVCWLNMQEMRVCM